MGDHLYAAIQAMPKIELHRHMEGSIRLQTLVDIAAEYEIEMPEYEVETVRPFVQMIPGEPRTWRNFLAKFSVLRQFFLSETIVRRITRETIVDAASDNVKYLELRFTPTALTGMMHCSIHDAVGWVCEAAARASAECDIEVALIVSMNRHESLAEGEQATQAAIDFRHEGVVGLDLAGREFGHPASPFSALFARASEAGLGVTVHAGEWDGWRSVENAIGNIKLDRIGHGVRAVENETIVDMLVQNGAVLEVCPTSNVQSGVVLDMRTHPIAYLKQRGVRLTINTDDPLICDISLSEELYRSVRDCELSLDDIKQMTLMAARSTFLPPSRRANLVERFQSWLYP